MRVFKLLLGINFCMGLLPYHTRNSITHHPQISLIIRKIFHSNHMRYRKRFLELTGYTFLFVKHLYDTCISQVILDLMYKKIKFQKYNFYLQFPYLISFPCAELVKTKDRLSEFWMDIRKTNGAYYWYSPLTEEKSLQPGKECVYYKVGRYGGTPIGTLKTQCSANLGYACMTDLQSDSFC